VPTIDLAPPSDGGAGLERAAAALREDRYEWVVFTSANAVDALMEHVPDARSLGSTSIAAVGPATASALERYRLIPDLVPDHQLAEGLVEAFPDPPAPGASVLFPRAAAGREVLVDGLSEAGWEIDLVEAYRTVPAVPGAADLRAVAEADAACFTASSTVTGFLSAFGLAAVPPVVVCIGPVTAATAEDAGIRVAAVAASHTIGGLVAALVDVLAG
jgi:uroporphyrinogen III methyltransferase / synthase